jgi:hypothetical protein
VRDQNPIPELLRFEPSAPVSSASPPPSIFGSLAVREFDAPRFLREGPIAHREAPEQLDFYDYHCWAEDPRHMVTLAMVREMQARRLFRSVDVFDGRGSPDCLMTGAIDNLEEVDRGPDVSIEVALSDRRDYSTCGRVRSSGRALCRRAQSSNTARSLVLWLKCLARFRILSKAWFRRCRIAPRRLRCHQVPRTPHSKDRRG